MLDDSLFVSNTVHEKTVVLPDGTAHPLYFKELPAASFMSFYRNVNSQNEAQRDTAAAKLIAASLCDQSGAPVLTAEKAGMLKPKAMDAIFNAVLEVNGTNTKKNSESETTDGSGTS